MRRGSQRNRTHTTEVSLIDFITELETDRRLTLDSADGKPSWYAVVAPYLRRFRHDRHGPTSDLMPADRCLTMACRRLYRASNKVERAVMDGSSTLSGMEKARVFNKLCYLLAKEAGLTAAVILPPEDEKGEIES